MLVSGAFVVSSAAGLSTAALAAAQAAAPAGAPGVVTLGTAGPFAVLGGSTVTNTGPSVITGNLGVSPGTSITGFPPGIVNGTVHDTDAVATQAQADQSTAYNSLAGRTVDDNLTGTDLGGLTRTPGVVKFDSSAGLTGTLTLDGQGNPDSIFIFQVGSTLTTASASKVALTNGAQACHVYWQVGSSATLGTATDFAGNILALTSITATTGASVNGRLLAQNGAVTLDTNNVSKPTCAVQDAPAIAVDKSASPASRPAPGGAFTFTVVVTNESTESVTLTSLNDSVYGDLNGRGSCDTGGTIAAGGTYTCAFTGTFTGAAGDSETDTVTAVATDGGGTTATGSGSATVTLTPVSTRNGYIEICKRGVGGGVHGTFTFTVGSRTVRVPVNTCSPLLRVPAGNNTITEAATSGYDLADCTTRPSNRLVSCDRTAQTATVSVLPGSSARQTLVIFYNRVHVTPTPGGTLKLCKVAGPGVPVGTRISFTVDGKTVIVPAGRAPGGYCVIAGRFPLGTHVTITEHIPSGQTVTAITASPAERLLSATRSTGTAVVDVEKGFTDVTYTDSVTCPC